MDKIKGWLCSKVKEKYQKNKNDIFLNEYSEIKWALANFFLSIMFQLKCSDRNSLDIRMTALNEIKELHSEKFSEK